MFPFLERSNPNVPLFDAKAFFFHHDEVLNLSTLNRSRFFTTRHIRAYHYYFIYFFRITERLPATVRNIECSVFAQI